MKKNHGTDRASSPKRPASGSGYVLGRKAFAQVSAVEGIRLSGALESDLRQLRDATPERRRATLADKYGKR